MKRYSEQKGKQPFDWFEELSKKEISDEKWEILNLLASDWVTCACGNQCHIIPRRPDGQPLDEELSALGGVYGFYGAITIKDANTALDFLNQIEKRSATLIKEEIDKARAILDEYNLYLKN